MAKTDEELKQEAVTEEKVEAKEEKEDVLEETAECEEEKTSLEEEGAEEPQEDELTQLEQALQEKEEQVLRLSAEIANIQRRHKTEVQNAAKYRSQSLATQMLSSIDNLERALAIEADDEASENMKRGIQMVLESMQHAFKEEGIEEINPKGEIFDPNFHQSVSSVPLEEGQEANTVVEVYQKGYVLKDRVLRPAMVVVAQ
ncbi:nucleotide exchange factor GrpE [Aerococcus christensenii]|uniref:Protein GrpE n=1 Tax=Aerococcus christensenii TaxID=87541 RepID=A0A133Y0X3_9LACT|nr:nucleotide exchange factor GrpE [Aerococcus christensenii]KXB36831.1 co-chaperone GrpE [Aerococcus christensenii]MDK8233460.1 nucleotide exchange factor GrpE [Aerococcus christensenii]WEB71651.1 nucleotide exchange factor GrpE [Aerococcus christensenii]